MSFVVPGVLLLRPHKAEAFFGSVAGGLAVPANDVFTNLKDFLLDQLAFQLKNQVINKITSGLLNWINSGFEGSPAFVLDLDRFTNDLAISTGSYFINNVLAVPDVLCTPFRREINIALSELHDRRTSNINRIYIRTATCTLGDVINNNYDLFYNDFSQGGWEAWNQLIRPNNYRAGSYIIARAELDNRIAEREQEETKKLEFGRGFLTFEKCYLLPPEGQYGPAAPTTTKAEKEAAKAGGGYCETQTPGVVIEQQLNNTLPAGLEGLIAADEINEIIGALLSQLLNKVIGPDGLLGLSGGGGGGGNSYANQLGNQVPGANSENQSFLESLIQDSIDVENDYLGVQNQIVAKMEEIDDILDELLICYQNKGDSSGVQDTQDKKDIVAAALVNARQQVASSISIILQLEDLILRTQNSQTSNDVQEIYNDWQQLSLSVHDFSAVESARAELAELDDDIEDLEDELDDCDD